MKLELKHLAAYLPYNMRYLDNKNKIVDLKSIDNDVHLINFGWGDAKQYSEIKPILRPLSDLDKEITHDGKTFNPKFVIDMAFPSERMGLNPAIWSHRVVKKLHEWHFDVFGLIEQGLAIDINTLKL
jgi:hypothetical protein